MSYIGNGPGVASQRVVTTFTATAGQTTFIPSSGYTVGYCDVFFNGIKIVNGDDYTAQDGINVVLTTAAALNDTVEVVAYIPRGLSDGYLKSEADAKLALKADLVNGLVPASQLPSYVDDVLEYATLSAFPTTGETGKIYVDKSAVNKAYRWTGSAYLLITDLSAYYTSAQTDTALATKLTSANNLSDLANTATARSNIGLGNVENKSSATIRGEITSANVTNGLGYTPLNAASNLSDLTNTANARSNIGLSNVENKSSGTIRGEITKANVTSGLGYTPTSFTINNVYVGGNADTYYPVVFWSSLETTTRISIWKHVHDYQSWDGIVEFEVEYSPRGWGGYVGQCHVLRHRWDRRNYIANWMMAGPVGNSLVVWLRGQRNYYVRTSSNEIPSVYTTAVEVGSPPSYSNIVDSTTTIATKAQQQYEGYSSELLGVTPEGWVNMPNQPVMHVNRTGSWFQTSGSWMENPWDNVKVDNAGWFSTSTGRYTVQSAGAYQVTAYILAGNGAGGQLQIRKNGSIWGNSYSEAYGNSVASGSYVTVSASAIVQMSAGDYISAFVCANNNGTSSLHAESGFCIHKVT